MTSDHDRASRAGDQPGGAAFRAGHSTASATVRESDALDVGHRAAGTARNRDEAA